MALASDVSVGNKWGDNEVRGCVHQIQGGTHGAEGQTSAAANMICSVKIPHFHLPMSIALFILSVTFRDGLETCCKLLN